MSARLVLQAERYGGSKPSREQLERWREHAIRMVEEAEAAALDLIASSAADGLREKLAKIATGSLLLGSIQADLFEGRHS